MTDIHFREMDKADLPIVTKIENDCQSHPWTLLQFLDSFNAGHEGWLACRKYEGREMIVGFAIVSTVVDECTLLNLCVRPAFQNKGYGRSLLTYLLKKAREEGVGKYFLEVRASNSTAIRLYESMGFEKISIRRSYYPAPAGREDGVVYSLSSLS